jgi:hypothetical protein
MTGGFMGVKYICPICKTCSWEAYFFEGDEMLFRRDSLLKEESAEKFDQKHNASHSGHIYLLDLNWGS